MLLEYLYSGEMSVGVHKLQTPRAQSDTSIMQDRIDDSLTREKRPTDSDVDRHL